MRAEGIYDVDANTSIDQLSEDLNIKMPEVVLLFIMTWNAILSRVNFPFLSGQQFISCRDPFYLRENPYNRMNLIWV